MLLELDGRGPKYQQLTRALLAAIRDGSLPPGSRITPSRLLARQLSCARNVVLLAYEQLVTEGYFVSRPRAGTFVSSFPPHPMPQRAEAGVDGQDLSVGTARAVPSTLSPEGLRLVRAADIGRATTEWPRTEVIDFIHGVTEPDPRLVSRVRQGLAKALRDRRTLLYADPAGDGRLRAEIARRLHGARGIRRSPEQIVITSGAQQAIDICARLLLRRGDTVIVEDPGYEGAEAVFNAAGATMVPVPVDREGLNPALIPARVHRARLVYVTPSHQAPTGAVLSPARRAALLEWARSHGAYVLEDDYDGELRYTGPPIKALAAMAPEHDVIYCGTFAKVLFPSARLGYLALPESLVAPVVSAKWLSDRGSSGLMQRMLQELMASGEYDRHIRRMQRRCASRRMTLIRALRQYLGPDVEVSGDEGGLHLVAWLPRLSTGEVDALVAACRERDVGVYPVSRYAKRRLRWGGLVLGYGLVDERAIEVGVRRLAAAYRQLRTRRSVAQARRALASGS